MPLEIGLLLFPHSTQLDLTGAYEVFAKFPSAQVRLIWKQAERVAAVRRAAARLASGRP
jgi:cyclohexyl-isocyanide hydratase